MWNILWISCDWLKSESYRPLLLAGVGCLQVNSPREVQNEQQSANTILNPSGSHLALMDVNRALYSVQYSQQSALNVFFFFSGANFVVAAGVVGQTITIGKHMWGSLDQRSLLPISRYIWNKKKSCSLLLGAKSMSDSCWWVSKLALMAVDMNRNNERTLSLDVPTPFLLFSPFLFLMDNTGLFCLYLIDSLRNCRERAGDDTDYIMSGAWIDSMTCATKTVASVHELYLLYQLSSAGTLSKTSLCFCNCFHWILANF